MNLNCDKNEIPCVRRLANSYLCTISIMNTLLSILSFMGTFLTLFATSVLVAQAVICLFRWRKFDLNKPIDNRIIWAGLAFAILMIPFYYIPC